MTPLRYGVDRRRQLPAVGDVDEDGATGLGAEVDADRVPRHAPLP